MEEKPPAHKCDRVYFQVCRKTLLSGICQLMCQICRLFRPSTYPTTASLSVAAASLYIPVQRKMRKVNRFWSNAELEALEAGLERFGWGDWKSIKNAYPEALRDRDGVAI